MKWENLKRTCLIDSFSVGTHTFLNSEVGKSLGMKYTIYVVTVRHKYLI